MTDETKRWPLPVPLAVQRYVVDRNGNEVSSSAPGPVFERQRIIAPDAAVDEPMIIADMAGGGLEKAKALVLAANAFGPMREALREMEWSDWNPGVGHCCPRCSGSKHLGRHLAGCKLAAALRAAEVGVPSLHGREE